jgi:uncharacterized membrane protein YdjX (TVP38/TMEM64 family)
MHVSRSAATSLLGAVAFVFVGVLGAVNLSDGDWFIGGVMVACAIVGLWSLVVRLVQQRRRRPPGAFPPANKPAG